MMRGRRDSVSSVSSAGSSIATGSDTGASSIDSSFIGAVPGQLNTKYGNRKTNTEERQRRMRTTGSFRGESGVPAGFDPIPEVRKIANPEATGYKKGSTRIGALVYDTHDLRISSVKPGSIADQMELKPGELIKRVMKSEIFYSQDVGKALAAYDGNRGLTMEVWRPWSFYAGQHIEVDGGEGAVRPGQAIVEVPNTSSFGTMRIQYKNGAAASVPMSACRPLTHSFVNLDLNPGGNWMQILGDHFVFGSWLDTISGQAYLRTLYNTATPEKAFKWWKSNKWNNKYKPEDLHPKRSEFIARLNTKESLRDWMYNTEPGQEYMMHLKAVCNPDDVFKWNLARDMPDFPQEMEEFVKLYEDDDDWDNFLLSPFGLQWLASGVDKMEAADFRNTVVWLEDLGRMGRRLEREVRSLYPEARAEWLEKLRKEPKLWDSWLQSAIGREFMLTTCYRQEGQLNIRVKTPEDAFKWYFRNYDDKKNSQWPGSKQQFFGTFKGHRAEFAQLLKTGWGLEYLKTFAEYEDCVRWKAKMGAKMAAPGVYHPGLNDEHNFHLWLETAPGKQYLASLAGPPHNYGDVQSLWVFLRTNPADDIPRSKDAIKARFPTGRLFSEWCDAGGALVLDFLFLIAVQYTLIYDDTARIDSVSEWYDEHPCNLLPRDYDDFMAEFKDPVVFKTWLSTSQGRQFLKASANPKGAAAWWDGQGKALKELFPNVDAWTTWLHSPMGNEYLMTRANMEEAYTWLKIQEKAPASKFDEESFDRWLATAEGREYLLTLGDMNEVTKWFAEEEVRKHRYLTGGTEGGFRDFCNSRLEDALKMLGTRPKKTSFTAAEIPIIKNAIRESSSLAEAVNILHKWVEIGKKTVRTDDDIDDAVPTLVQQALCGDEWEYICKQAGNDDPVPFFDIVNRKAFATKGCGKFTPEEVQFIQDAVRDTDDMESMLGVCTKYAAETMPYEDAQQLVRRVNLAIGDETWDVLAIASAANSFFQWLRNKGIKRNQFFRSINAFVIQWAVLKTGSLEECAQYLIDRGYDGPAGRCRKTLYDTNWATVQSIAGKGSFREWINARGREQREFLTTQPQEIFNIRQTILDNMDADEFVKNMSLQNARVGMRMGRLFEDDDWAAVKHKAGGGAFLDWLNAVGDNSSTCYTTLDASKLQQAVRSTQNLEDFVAKLEADHDTTAAAAFYQALQGVRWTDVHNAAGPGALSDFLTSQGMATVGFTEMEATKVRECVMEHNDLHTCIGALEKRGLKAAAHNLYKICKKKGERWKGSSAGTSLYGGSSVGSGGSSYGGSSMSDTVSSYSGGRSSSGRSRGGSSDSGDDEPDLSGATTYLGVEQSAATLSFREYLNMELTGGDDAHLEGKKTSKRFDFTIIEAAQVRNVVAATKTRGEAVQRLRDKAHACSDAKCQDNMQALAKKAWDRLQLEKHHEETRVVAARTGTFRGFLNSAAEKVAKKEGMVFKNDESEPVQKAINGAPDLMECVTRLEVEGYHNLARRVHKALRRTPWLDVQQAGAGANLVDLLNVKGQVKGMCYADMTEDRLEQLVRECVDSEQLQDRLRDEIVGGDAVAQMVHAACPDDEKYHDLKVLAGPGSICEFMQAAAVRTFNHQRGALPLQNFVNEDRWDVLNDAIRTSKDLADCIQKMEADDRDDHGVLGDLGVRIKKACAYDMVQHDYGTEADKEFFRDMQSAATRGSFLDYLNAHAARHRIFFTDLNSNQLQHIVMKSKDAREAEYWLEDKAQLIPEGNRQQAPASRALYLGLEGLPWNEVIQAAQDDCLLDQLNKVGWGKDDYKPINGDDVPALQSAFRDGGTLEEVMQLLGESSTARPDLPTSLSIALSGEKETPEQLFQKFKEMRKARAAAFKAFLDKQGKGKGKKRATLMGGLEDTDVIFDSHSTAAVQAAMMGARSMDDVCEALLATKRIQLAERLKKACAGIAFPTLKRGAGCMSFQEWFNEYAVRDRGVTLCCLNVKLAQDVCAEATSLAQVNQELSEKMQRVVAAAIKKSLEGELVENLRQAACSAHLSDLIHDTVGGRILDPSRPDCGESPLAEWIADDPHPDVYGPLEIATIQGSLTGSPNCGEGSPVTAVEAALGRLRRKGQKIQEADVADEMADRAARKIRAIAQNVDLFETCNRNGHFLAGFNAMSARGGRKVRLIPMDARVTFDSLAKASTLKEAQELMYLTGDFAVGKSLEALLSDQYGTAESNFGALANAAGTSSFLAFLNEKARAVGAAKFKSSNAAMVQAILKDAPPDPKAAADRLRAKKAPEPALKIMKVFEKDRDGFMMARQVAEQANFTTGPEACRCLVDVLNSIWERSAVCIRDKKPAPFTLVDAQMASFALRDSFNVEEAIERVRHRNAMSVADKLIEMDMHPKSFAILKAAASAPTPEAAKAAGKASMSAAQIFLNCSTPASGGSFIRFVNMKGAQQPSCPQIASCGPDGIQGVKMLIATCSNLKQAMNKLLANGRLFLSHRLTEDLSNLKFADVKEMSGTGAFLSWLEYKKEAQLTGMHFTEAEARAAKEALRIAGSQAKAHEMLRERGVFTLAQKLANACVGLMPDDIMAACGEKPLGNDAFSLAEEDLPKDADYAYGGKKYKKRKILTVNVALELQQQFIDQDNQIKAGGKRAVAAVKKGLFMKDFTMHQRLRTREMSRRAGTCCACEFFYGMLFGLGTILAMLSEKMVTLDDMLVELPCWAEGGSGCCDANDNSCTTTTTTTTTAAPTSVTYLDSIGPFKPGLGLAVIMVAVGALLGSLMLLYSDALDIGGNYNDGGPAREGQGSIARCITIRPLVYAFIFLLLCQLGAGGFIAAWEFQGNLQDGLPEYWFFAGGGATILVILMARLIVYMQERHLKRRFKAL